MGIVLSSILFLNLKCLKYYFLFFFILALQLFAEMTRNNGLALWVYEECGGTGI